MTKTDDDDANKQYGEKVLTQSNWIDTEFLEQVLSSTLEEEVKVLDHSITAAVGVGDNYLSMLYKTNVNYTGRSGEKKNKHLMIKGVPTAKVLLEMIDEMGIFVKEIAMYGKTLPAMHRYIKEYFPEDTVHVSPEAYKCTRENTLVMEDLGESGYKMANRRNQLDFDHTIITLRTLARFHALAAKLYQDDPALVMSVSKDFYDEDSREKMEPFLDMTFPVLASAVEKWEGSERFVPLLKEVGVCIYDKMMHMLSPRYKFNVLNHGDMWVNNILYKYNDDGGVIGAKLVDYQLSRYTTPAADLQYFLFTSVQPDVLSAHRTEMLTTYHQALTKDMATLGLDIAYTFQQLEEDLLETAGFAVLAMAQLLPIIVAPPSEVFDMDGLDLDDFKNTENMKDDHPMMKNYRNDHYKNVASKVLKIIESIGYFDAVQERMKDVVAASEEKKALREAEKAAEVKTE